MSNQKNEWNFQDNVTKKEFKVLYDTLKRAKLPFSTEHNAMYGLEDLAMVLLHMCKTGLLPTGPWQSCPSCSEMIRTSVSQHPSGYWG